MATYIGNDNNNNNNGSQQNQYGIGGDDSLTPNNDDKSYFLYGGNGNDQLLGFSYDDELYGGADNDELHGYNGNDYLDGGSGADDLYGDYGNDILSGGRDSDWFFFDTELNKSKNFDKILDFESGTDQMRLSKDVFTGVGKVNSFLSSGKFEVGSDATSSKTRILYNEDKGIAYFTPDGSSGGKTKFVKVAKGMELDHDDFFIIA